MNTWVFACRNIADKLRKTCRKPSLLGFYLRTYVLSPLQRVRPDVYIVSYPKCGRTWLRVIIQKYLAASGSDPQPFLSGSIFRMPGGRILAFTHDQGQWVPAPVRTKNLRFDARKYRGTRVVFLVRDPRDALVSSWYHLRYRESIIKDDLSWFIREPDLGVAKIVGYMNLWLRHESDVEEFLLLTYEDLHRDPLDVVRRLFSFTGVDVDEKLLAEAVTESSFDRMKKMEKSGSLDEPWMNPGRQGDGSSMKVRKGKVGGYKEELPPEDVQYLDDFIKANLTARLPYGGEGP